MAAQREARWSRGTPWRQGQVLGVDAVETMGLGTASDAASACVVVISHDCDLANDDPETEPHVEVIVGRVVASANGNFSWGKAPRTLHLPMQRDGAAVTVELVATRKQLVSKSELAQFEPDRSFALNQKERAVLRSWLAARYQRAAFPDAFVRRMSQTRLDEKLAKAVGPRGDIISFIYFDLDEGQSIERADADPYALSVVLVYHPGDDPEESETAAQQVVEALLQMCETRLKNSKDLVVKRCICVSEDDLTVSQARVLTQWRLEYMTLKADEDQLGPVQI